MHNDNERSNYFDQVRRLIKIESEVTSKGIIIQGHISLNCIFPSLFS